jgi:hypothetical protein
MTHFSPSGLHDGAKSVAAFGSARTRSYHPWSNCRSKTRNETAAAETSGRNGEAAKPQHNQSHAGTRTRRRESSTSRGPKFQAGQSPPGVGRRGGVPFDIRAWAIEHERLWLTLPVGSAFLCTFSAPEVAGSPHGAYRIAFSHVMGSPTSGSP